MSQQAESSNTHSYSDDKELATKPPQLSETIWHLPRQYVKVLLTRSSWNHPVELSLTG